MATFADMRARIADEMANDGDISTAQINNAIQSTIADYSSEAFWFNEAVATLNTVANQELYTSADLADIPNIINIISMRLGTAGSYTGYIDGIMNDSFEGIQDGSVKGAPQYYSRFANKIRLYPIPDTVYALKLSYITTLATLVADGDTNSWMTDAEEVIRQGAKKRIAADYLASNELAQRFSAMEDKAYEGLRQENRMRRPQQLLRAGIINSRPTFNIYNGW